MAKLPKIDSEVNVSRGQPRRLMIVTDGDRWYVRRVASVRHDLDRDEMIYTCDKPIDHVFDELDEAVRIAKTALSNPRSRAWK